MLGFLRATYPFYVVPAAVGVLILWWYARKRAQWSLWEVNMLFVPYVAWVLLWLIDESNKDMGNLIEPVIFGVEVLLLAGLRIALWKRVEVKTARLLMSLCLLASAVLVWWLMPEISR